MSKQHAPSEWLAMVDASDFVRHGDIGELMVVMSAQLESPSKRGLLLCAIGEVQSLASRWLRQQGREHDPCRSPEEGADPAQEFLDRCVTARTAIRAAIVVTMLTLRRAPPPQRRVDYYPAVLVNDCPTLLHENAPDGHVAQLVLNAADVDPDGHSFLNEATRNIPRGFGATLAWPTETQSARVASAATAHEVHWVNAGLSTWSTLRPRPKKEARRRFERARMCCGRAGQAYLPLSLSDGWLRFLLDYKLTVLQGVEFWTRAKRGSEVVDAALWELAWFINLGNGGEFPSDDRLTDLGGPQGRRDAERQRLKRARHRVIWTDYLSVRSYATSSDAFCVDESGQFDEVLDELSRRYFSALEADEGEEESE